MRVESLVLSKERISIYNEVRENKSSESTITTCVIFPANIQDALVKLFKILSLMKYELHLSYFSCKNITNKSS